MIKEIKWVPINEIKPNKKNRNSHSEEQIKRLADIISYQGFRTPLIVSNRTGLLVAGHGRLLAAKQLSLKSVPVSYQDFDSEEQEYAAGVSDNAIASWSELDLSGINQDIPELGPDFNIDMLGIKDFVLEPADKYGDKDADMLPEVRETAIRLGDVFILGEHRLLCGDSTHREQVERLMNGEKADMVFTDPPYGVSYADKNAFLGTIGKANCVEKRIENDHQTPEEMADLWLKFLEVAHGVTTDKCSYYICSPQGGELMMMMMMIPKAGWQLKHMLIWAKNNHVLGRADYNYKHEPILYGWKEKGTHEFYGKGATTTLWEYDKPLKNDLHPTMKPIAIMENALLNSTKSGQMAYDPFLGSGSTLIACEKTNRKCYGMEIDPQYCQVIIDRWEKFTGKKAVKV